MRRCWRASSAWTPPPARRSRSRATAPNGRTRPRCCGCHPRQPGRPGPDAGRPPSMSFTRVIEMLDRLVVDGATASHVEVAPPPSQAAQRPCPAAPHRTLAVWAFPKIPVMAAGVERWYMRSFRHRPPSYVDVRRTAMVRSIVVGASVVHWIETEPRGPGDRQHSLVFTQGGTLHLTAVVTRLLEWPPGGGESGRSRLSCVASCPLRASAAPPAGATATARPPSRMRRIPTSALPARWPRSARRPLDDTTGAGRTRAWTHRWDRVLPCRISPDRPRATGTVL